MVRRPVEDKWFEADPHALEELRQVLGDKYPTLHAFESEERVTVSGVFRLTQGGAVIDRYSVEIHLPDDYPRSIPCIWETGGLVPRTEDWHVNTKKDHSLCLGIPAQLWVQYQGRFDIATFLDGPVRSFFIGIGLVKSGEPWPYGAWDHREAGLWQFYAQTLGTDDKLVILRFLLKLTQSKVKGHWPCPCGSGEIIRRCPHAAAIGALRSDVPQAIILHSFNSLCNALQQEMAKQETPIEGAGDGSQRAASGGMIGCLDAIRVG